MTKPPKDVDAGAPSYYKGMISGRPAWDQITDFKLGYFLGCAWKYISRAGRKTPDPRKDLRKAIHCIEKYIEIWEDENDEQPIAMEGEQK